MTNPIHRSELEKRVGGRDLRDECIDVSRGTVREEDRSRLCTQFDHVAGTIIFLVSASTFVFLDDVTIVLVERVTAGNADLFMGSHPQTVQVQAWERFADERSLSLELSEL